MAAWGNALGGFRRQRRDARGRFAGGKIASRSKKKVIRSKKKVARKTTVSRSNGTTYRTTHQRGLLGGTTVTTTAYRGREYRGSVEGFHRNGKATVDFLYVTPSQRGKGVSKALVSRQVYHARKHGLTVHAPGDRSDGGQKFIDRNSITGAKVGKRSSMSSAEVTEVMNGIGAANALRHQKQYDKALKKKAAHSKKMSTKKKVAIGAGVVAGTAAIGAAAYGHQYLSMNKEFKRSGGGLSTRDLGNGVSVTTTRSLKLRHTTIDPVAVNDVYESTTVGQVVKAGARVWRPSIRPQIHETSYLHKDGALLGYSKDVIKGKKLYANEVYLRPSERGQRRTVAALSKMGKTRMEEQVARGRKVVISKYRSEDSERVVRNQARKLGENKVIVQKRYNPSSNFAKEITQSMDTYFSNNITNEFNKVRKARKAGMVI